MLVELVKFWHVFHLSSPWNVWRLVGYMNLIQLSDFDMKTLKVENTSLLGSVLAQVENGNMVLEIEIWCSQSEGSASTRGLSFFSFGFWGGWSFCSISMSQRKAWMCFYFGDWWLIPVLGDSQVFFNTHWVRVLEEFTRATLGLLLLFIYLLNYFSRDLGKVPKIWKKIFTWFSKCRVSHISNLPIFKDSCQIPIFKFYFV